MNQRVMKHVLGIAADPHHVVLHDAPGGFLLYRLHSHRTGLGCWVSRMPKRFFTKTRCRENLSSGENRAGWAELVGSPSGFNFFHRKRQKQMCFWKDNTRVLHQNKVLLYKIQYSRLSKAICDKYKLLCHDNVFRIFLT